MMFWFVIFLLGLVALAFVAAPILLVKKEEEDEGSRQDVNLALFEEHVANLVENTSEVEQIELEAKRSLLEDTSADISRSKIAGGASGARVLLATGILIPLLSLILYADFGAGRGAIPDVRLAEEMQSIEGADPEVYRDLIEKMAERAEKRPEDSELNFFLARSYSAMGEYEKAVVVFERLLVYFENDPGLNTYYAEALFVADNRRMTERVRAAVDTALSLNPHDITLLEIEGIAAINGGQAKEALNWFQKALATGVTGRRADMIRTAMSRIHEQLGIEGDVPVEPAGRVLNISVSAANQVELPLDSAVFVYARATSGPPAPLAVVRLRLSDLPTTVRLDEGMAMMPGMGLGDFDQVTVIARISRAGDVVPKSGDYEVRSADLNMSSVPAMIELLIQDQIP